MACMTCLVTLLLQYIIRFCAIFVPWWFTFATFDLHVNHDVIRVNQN
jgi:hypothetical protein